MKRMNLIERQALAAKIRSLRMTITKIQVGEAVFAAENARDFRDNVLRIIDEQPAVEPANQTADEVFQAMGYRKISEKPLYTIYENKEGERIYLKFSGGRYAMNLLVYATRAPSVARELDAKEILACARLIEELEANKENGKS